MISWFTIASDHSYREYNAPNPKLRCKYWLKEIKTDEYITSNGNVNDICEYHFFDNKLRKTTPEYDGWCLSNVRDPKVKHAFHADLEVIIIDPLGELKNMTGEHWYDLKGVIAALNFLLKISHFSNWDSYMMNSRNLNLEKKQVYLESMVEAFRNTKYYTQLEKKIESFESSDDKNRNELKNYLRRKGLTQGFYEKWIKEE